MGITLTQLLDARDDRRARQLCLLASHPHRTLVVLTVNIPGSEKRTDDSLLIARAALAALHDRLDIVFEENRDLPTGWESYLLVSSDPESTKCITVDIESAHPLGRLMDIDVFRPDGIPMSRRDSNQAQRKCLICDDDARACMRAAKHTVDQLTDKIHLMVHEYRSCN